MKFLKPFFPNNNTPMLLYSLILICLSTTLYSQTQKVRFLHLGIENGLSQSSVYCIYQDSKGFLWFATEDGLNKYDGYNFTIYKPDKSNKSSISNNYVYCLIEDDNGIFWIGTDEGLNTFDKNTEQFTHYMFNPNDSNSISNNRVYNVFEDESGSIWIGTNNGLNRFERDKNQFIRYSYNPDNPFSLSNNYITSIAESKNGILWFGTSGGGLNSFDKNNDRFVRYQHDPDNKNSLVSNDVLSLFVDNKGLLWIGTKDFGLNIFNPSKNEFTEFGHEFKTGNSFTNNSVNCIYQDKEYNTWIGTNLGLYQYLPDQNILQIFKFDINNSFSLTGNKILSIFEDYSGILWVGTYAANINKYSKKFASFLHFHSQPGENNSLSSNLVRSFYLDDKEILWVGTEGGGLNKFDSKKRKMTIFKNNPLNPNSISGDYVFSICEDRNKQLWLGLKGAGLNRFDTKTEIFFQYKHNPKDPQSLSNDLVRNILFDPPNTIWIGTDGGGFNKFDIASEKFKSYQNEHDDANSLPNNRVFSIEKDISSRYLWIGTFGGGLSKFDIEKESFINYESDPEGENSLSNNYILSIYQDSLGILWIGSNGGGLTKFDPVKNTFKSYTETNGLSHNSVYGILSDNNNNLWLSTNKGISKFNPETESFKNYDVYDGLQSNEFSGGAYYKSKKGWLYFGGINGFNAFDPTSLVENSKPPKIVITDFLLFNKHVNISNDHSTPLHRSISETKTIILSYKENIFSFEFASLDYTSPEENEYAFMMEGFENNWNYVKGRRFATYTSLEPGEYKFRVKGSNSDGVWNEEGASVIVIITPPFWDTVWFKSISVLTLIAILLFYIKYRTRQIEEQKRQLEIMVEQRTSELCDANATKDKFFSIISHDLKGPFSAVISLIDLMINDFKEFTEDEKEFSLKQIQLSARNTYNLLENLLLWSRTQRGKIEINPETLDLNEMIDESLQLLSTIAKRKNITLTNGADKNLTALGDKNTIKTVINNLVSNSLKFTPINGKVNVTGKTDGDFITISINDTGVGIGEADLKKLFRIDVSHTTKGTEKEVGTGLGLILCKEFVEKNGGKIWVESELHKGSSFIFTVPKIPD